MLRKRFALISVALVSTMALLVGCASPLDGEGAGKEVTIGSKEFTESVLLAHVVAQLVEANTDVKVHKKLSLGGSSVTFDGVKNGDLDMYVEYDGTAYGVHLGHKEPITEPDALYDKVKKEFEETHKITWSRPFGINNTYAIAIPTALAEQHKIKSISDLAPHSDKFVFGTTNEFKGRAADGFEPLVAAYGLKFKDVKAMQSGLRYPAIEQGEIQAMDAYATDAKLKEFGLTVLKDDKDFFPPYNAGLMIRMDTVEKYPEIIEAVNKLEGVLTDQIMQDLNYQVEIEGKDEEAVAKDFLTSKGLIK